MLKHSTISLILVSILLISGINGCGESEQKTDLKTIFQWHLSEEVDTTINAEVYDIDLFDSDKTIINELHSKGSKVICYISVGSWEEWREDSNKFPESVIGKDYENWEGEKWLDIRKIDSLAPIMEARFDLCKEKGFDGIEPDNMDGFLQDTGFPLTYEDQIKYNIWLAEQAHKRGLTIGLKNDETQSEDLLQYFDWALTEDCFADDWCEEVSNFQKSGKPVYMVEYTDNNLKTEDFCPTAQELGYIGVLKNRNLDSWIESC